MDSSCKQEIIEEHRIELSESDLRDLLKVKHRGLPDVKIDGPWLVLTWRTRKTILKSNSRNEKV